MAIYEREGAFHIDPFQFGGKPGEAIDGKSVVIKRNGKAWDWSHEFLGTCRIRAIMDVLGDEISILESGIWGDSNNRLVIGEAINRDLLARRYFIFRPQI